MSRHHIIVRRRRWLRSPAIMTMPNSPKESCALVEAKNVGTSNGPGVNAARAFVEIVTVTASGVLPLGVNDWSDTLHAMVASRPEQANVVLPPKPPSGVSVTV